MRLASALGDVEPVEYPSVGRYGGGGGGKNCCYGDGD